MSVLPSDVRYYGCLHDPAYDGSTTLNGAISSTGATSVTIASASTFPPSTSSEFGILIDSEQMWVTQGMGTTSLTVIRGFGGTAAATHGNAVAVTMPSGGLVDFSAKLDFSDVTSGDKLDLVSSSASDTKCKFLQTGRDTAGIIQNETLTATGQTVVTGTQAWDRLLQTTLAAVTTSSASITAAATSLSVTLGTAFYSPSNYNIMMGREIMTVTGGQGTTTLTVTRGALSTTATAHASGDNIYLMPIGDIGIVDHTKVITNNTAQSGGALSGAQPAYIRLAAGSAASVSLGQILRTQGGTGANQIRQIISTSVTSGGSTLSDAVGVDSAWGTVPDNTTTYDIWNGAKYDISPNPIGTIRRFLYNAAADVAGGSQKLFYQKVFSVNNNTTIALTAAQVQDVANTGTLPGGATLDLAVATASNDSQIVATRQTAFSTGYGSYVVQPSATNYGANGGNLVSGSAPNAAGAQGVVLRLTLNAGTNPYKGYADLRTTGNTI